jgi:DNA-directed RNA polymerase specialized sigma24 family protein
MRVDAERSEAHNDPALAPFLEARSESEAEQALARLISEEVGPLVEQIVTYKLRAYAGAKGYEGRDDVEDLCSETLVNLLARLNELRGRTSAEGIRHLRGYVAVTAYRACYEYLRRKYPRRYSLKNKLRYFLTHRQGFALWEAEDGEWMAGLFEWSGQGPAEPQAGRERAPGRDTRPFEHGFAPHADAGASLSELLTAVFKWSGRAVELDELVNIVAEAWKIKDRPSWGEAGDERAALEYKGDGHPRADGEVYRRAYLEKLWVEIRRMSPAHCAALLLNLRDARGACAIELFLITGVASFAQLAGAVGRTEEWLAAIWNRLPVDDLTIAEHLGLNRQQVINLRKSARLRLARRMGELGF